MSAVRGREAEVRDWMVSITGSGGLLKSFLQIPSNFKGLERDGNFEWIHEEGFLARIGNFRRLSVAAISSFSVSGANAYNASKRG